MLRWLAGLAVLLVSLNASAASEFQPMRDVVVQIRQGKGSCSAVVIAPDRLLTAKHCKQGDMDRFQVGNKTAVVEFESPKSDIMTLKLLAGSFKEVASVCAREPQQDDKVWLVGYPLGIGQVVTEGHLQFLRGDMYLATAPAIFGNSGGGLFVKQNDKFCLVGIVSQGAGVENQFITHLISSVAREPILNLINGTYNRQENPSGNRVPSTGKR